MHKLTNNKSTSKTKVKCHCWELDEIGSQNYQLTSAPKNKLISSYIVYYNKQLTYLFSNDWVRRKSAEKTPVQD